MGVETTECIELLENKQFLSRKSVDKSSNLEDVRKALFAAVESGDQMKAEDILEVIKMNQLQNDFRDEIGRSAYHYVIEGGFVSIMESLLDAGIPVGDALLMSVAASFHDGTVLICKYAETLPAEERESILECRSENGEFHPEMSPLKLAAMRNNFHIVEVLLNAGAAPLSLPQASQKSSASLADVVSLLDYYRAISSEAYLGLAHNDPLDNAFRLSRKLKEMGNDWEEFNAQFFEMARRVERFSASLLDHLASSIELQTLFKQCSSPTINPLPKVETAIAYEQKDFVAHAYSQGAMSLEFYQGFSSTSNLHLFLLTSLMVIVYPVISVIYLVYQNSYLGSILKTPFMKLWTKFGSDLMLVILVAVHSPMDKTGYSHVIVILRSLLLVHCIALVIILCVFRAFHTVFTSFHAIFVIWKSTIGAIRELVRFSVILGGVLVSIAIGMNAISLAQLYARCSESDDEYSLQTYQFVDERFNSLPSSVLTLYWALYAVRGQTVRPINDDTAYVRGYYVFFAAFFVLAVIIGLNLLIAILSAQLTKVQRNSDIEWKFGRAQLWLRVIEPDVDLPPPFNLIPKSGTLLRKIRSCVRRETPNQREDGQTPEDTERAAKIVIHKLLERYRDYKRQSMSGCCGFSAEDFRILKRDFVSLRNHLMKIVRIIEQSIESLHELVDGLNVRIKKLNDSDMQLDGIDHHRVQIQDDDFDQMTDDVMKLQKCVRRAVARLQRTSLISHMAAMYAQGRTVVNDAEVRDKLESYRKDFDNYAMNLYS